ncbi:MAG: hypothetical protein AAFX54_12735 [Pseudomonadota bacterium]
MARQNKRDGFSNAVKLTLRERVGGRCSQPSCRKPTIGPDKSSDDKSTTIGVAAHICAASVGGPRYNNNQSPLERSSIKNGIWLCANCASLIDKNGGQDYPVPVLKNWKKNAEERAHEALISTSAFQRPSWLTRLSTIHFANVPRLAQLDTDEPLSEEVMQTLNDGFPTQGMIIRELVSLEKAIASADVSAIPIEDIVPASEEIIGCTISFHRSCYTKNGMFDKDNFDLSTVRNFDPKKSPHIYTKIGTTKIILPYDPRWVTTNTAYSDFRSGHTKFAGLGIVKRVSLDASQIVVSPLLIGLPRHPAWDGIF